MKRLACFAALCAIVLGALAVFAACGGEEEQPAEPTPTTNATPFARPTPDPSVPLVQYESSSAGYSISHPEGWEVTPQGASGDRFTLYSADRAVLAELIVSCYKGENQTVDGLIIQDAGAVANIGAGYIDPTTAAPIEVDGISGKQLTYITSVQAFVIEHVATYAVDERCGWRLGLSTYGQGTLDPYLPIYQRMIESFQVE